MVQSSRSYLNALILDKAYGKAVYIWGVGCVFAELIQTLNANPDKLSQRSPLFPGSSCYPLSPQKAQSDQPIIDMLLSSDQINVICTIVGTPKPKDLEFIKDNETVKQYLSLLPVYDRVDLRSKFFYCSTEATDLLDKMLVFNPNNRITAKEALEHPYFKNMTKLPESNVECSITEHSEDYVKQLKQLVC